jgi:hypothetical protein
MIVVVNMDIEEKINIVENVAQNAFKEDLVDINIPEDWSLNVMQKIQALEVSSLTMDFKLERKIFNISWVAAMAAAIILFVSMLFTFQNQTNDFLSLDDEIQALYTDNSYNTLIAEMME